VAELNGAMQVLVATYSKHLASHVERKAKYGKLTPITVEPTADAVLARVGESEPCLVVIDALKNEADALAIVKVLSESRQKAKAVILGRSPDLSLVARAIVAGASHFLLESTPADEFGKTLADLVAGKQPNEESLFGRVFGSLPASESREGWFRTRSGRRLSTEDAIKQCDQFGFSVDEIIDYLKVPSRDAERITKKARKVVKPSLMSQIASSVMPPGGFGMPSRRVMLGGLAVIVSILVAVRFLSREPPRHLIAGEVTYQGKPLKVGLIRFTPQGQAESARPIVAGEIRDGQYTVKSGHGSDGGSYKVQISGFTGVPKKAGPVMDPLGDELFPDVVRTATIPCSDHTFNVKCD